MKVIKAGGGVVHRFRDKEEQVVLIFRKGVWDLPKGKKEEGESMQKCARREVAEETGMKLPAIKRFITKTHHQYERNGHYLKKQTHWYLMKTVEKAVFFPQKKEGITNVAWVDISRAKKMVGYANLRKVLKKVKPI